jgi:putative ABC transport system permease protein
MTAVPLDDARTPSTPSASRLRPGDLLPLGSLGLRIRKVRTALTAVGIAIGIAAMVAVLGISSSSRADLLAQLDALGTNLLQVSPGQTVMGETAELPAESAAMLGRIAPVTAAAAYTTVEASVYRNDLVPESETQGLSVLAVDTDLLAALEGSMQAGRFLDEATADQPVVVLGSVAAERLGITDLEGQPMVRVGDSWFAVAGIVDALPLAPQIERAALIGYPAAASYFDTTGSPTSVFLRTEPDQVDAVRGVAGPTADPQNPEEVTVSRPSDALDARDAADTAFTALLLGLGAVALLVGAVGIANVMVISVLERRTEIGVRRALGATRGHVRSQFLVESALLAGIGGVGGVLLGSLVTAGYTVSQGWPFAVPMLALVGGVALALAIGALAGLYPAARAARLDPAQAVHPSG